MEEKLKANKELSADEKKEETEEYYRMESMLLRTKSISSLLLLPVPLR